MRLVAQILKCSSIAAYNLIFYEASLLFKKKKVLAGLLLVVQWLRLQVPNIGDPGSIPGQGARSLHVAIKTWHQAQPNK